VGARRRRGDTWFARSPKCIERLTATGGGMMIGLGGMLLVTGPKH
jgi:hypothetical protein